MRCTHVVDRSDGDRVDRRPGQSPTTPAKRRPSGRGVDDHPEHGVDEREHIGARAHRGLGDLGQLVGVRRELREHREAEVGAAHGLDDLGGGLDRVGEDAGAVLEVRAAHVHLDGVDLRPGEEDAGLGVLLENVAPELGTTGWQMLIWGFFISTVACYHGTYTINSLSHVFGRQRYRTGDTSRNNWLLAIITLGEGWHNNHHHYPSATRQGFYWWEIDITFYVLKLLSWLGIIWDLKPVPTSVRDHSPRRIAPLR